MRSALDVSFLLKTSRPGLWFPTLWLYFVPLGRQAPLNEWSFWWGLWFVTFPLNFVIYGWNDIVDAETDAANPRKDSYLFGARPDEAQRARLPKLILAVTVLGSTPLIVRAGWPLLLVVALIGLFNWLYNNAGGGLRQRPPWELLAQVGYLLVVPLSAMTNEAPLPGLSVWVYLSLFAVQSHLIGEVMDVVPDANAGRSTTATVIGVHRTKLLIIGIVLAELGVVWFWIDDLPLSGMLVFALAWLLLDVTWLFRNRGYSLRQMRLAGVGSNVMALLSAAYVWYSGCLVD